MPEAASGTPGGGFVFEDVMGVERLNTCPGDVSE